MNEDRTKYKLTEEFLRREYVENKRSSYDIAKTVGCNYQTICRHLKNFNIEVSNIQFNLSKEFLEYEYLTNKKSCSQIANEVGCTSTWIKIYLKRFNILRRPKSMANLGKFGELSANYIDGRTYIDYPREFNDQLKNKIKNRDNHICQNCRITEYQHKLENRNRGLDIHHIDYDKENCNESNLITLCSSCNCKANGNRFHWQKYYTSLIEAYCNV